MSELVRSAPTPIAEVPPWLVGPRRRWTRDWAWIGLASGALAPAGTGIVFLPELLPMLLVCAIAGGGLGAAIGFVAPPVLEGVRGRVPIPLLLLMGLPIGALWGGITGALGAVAALGLTEPGIVALFGLCAALAGAVQLGATWFPYTFASVMRRATWPIVVLACCLAPLLGWLGFFGVVLLMGGL